jgi:hypothetical protein
MDCHSEHRVSRFARRGWLAVLLLAGSVGWQSLALGQTPPAAAPPGAAAGTPAVAPAGEGAAAESPTTGPNLEATASAKRSACERYIGSLTGSSKDGALRDNPEVRKLASQVPDLVTCVAIKGDSEALCNPLIGESAGKRMYSSAARDCLYTQSMFHEAHAYPKGRSFMFPDIEFKQCQNPTWCEAMREALRSADEKKCAATGALQSICRAYIRLDKSQCRIEGTLPKQKDGQADEASTLAMCKETIETRGFLGNGLQSLAQSGQPREQAFAKAALGEANACASFEQAAMDACTGGGSSPPSGATPAPGTSGAAPASGEHR